jgi:PAS domain S-box-containing protein
MAAPRKLPDALGRAPAQQGCNVPDDTFFAVMVLDEVSCVLGAGPDLRGLQAVLGQPVVGAPLSRLLPGWEPANGGSHVFTAADKSRRFLACGWTGPRRTPGGAVIYDLDRLERRREELHDLRDINRELQAIMAASYDVIYVTDGKGDTLRVSAAALRLFGLTEAELVGRNVRDLEREGVFRPSASARVLETGKPMTVVQDTKAGRRLLVYSTPIRDEQNRLVRIINTSRDITELSQLQLQLEETHQRAARYLQEIEELRRCRGSDSSSAPDGPVFRSGKMAEVKSLAEQVAMVDSTVLLLGESGVGKEVLAKLIHRTSPRRERPMVAVNCGAIPPDLLESELFGYERGAFTGANREGKRGLFELASGGTVLLDEVAELPSALQVKLLRVLQQREITRVGGLKPVSLDIRILAATNRNLQEMVRAGRFREDLYYRLNVIPIQIPPLRERREEIATLVHHFLGRFNQQYGRQVGVTPATLEALERYDWPGNVRELENVVERMVVVGISGTVDVLDLPSAIRPPGPEWPAAGDGPRELVPLQQAVEALEAQLILEAYERFGNTYKVAEVLGVNQSTVVRKLKKYRANAPKHSR